MPELPEIETIRLALKPDVENQQIKSISNIERHKRHIKDTGDLRVSGVLRHGKKLAFATTEGYLTFGLGMSGYFHWKGPIRHDLLSIRFKNNRTLYYNDVRKFGTSEWWEDFPGNNLGIDGINSKLLKPGRGRLVAQLFASCPNKEIKVALLEQDRIAGIGNIYASEILHRIGVHPATKVKDIPKLKWTALAETTYRVLTKAVKNGGTIIEGVANEYRTPKGTTGTHQNFLQVYNRTGLKCLTCAANNRRGKIVSETQGGRTTYFCPVCQIHPNP